MKDPTTPHPTGATRHHRQPNRDKGFTLVEILISIVLVGVLSAVVVVGVGNLTSKGTTSACAASLDAAKAGAIVYYSTNANAYPTTLSQMTTASPAILTLPTGVTVTAPANVAATGNGWTLTMTAGVSGNPPTFACT